MKIRPIAVTVICWILIVSGLLTLALFAISSARLNDPKFIDLMKQSPMPMGVQLVVGGMGSVLSLAAGISMLFGKPWGRLLYVGWGVFGLFFAAIITPSKGMIIPGALFFVVAIFFLFRPQSTKYFLSPKA